MSEHQLPYLNDTERLQAFEAITNGCMHLWSKNKLQMDRFNRVMDNFIKLADKDPYFLAHFTSYAIQKLDSKDLKVVATFINSLSDADGTPFTIVGNDGKVTRSVHKKPNLRIVSQSAIQFLPPKMVLRVMELANLKLSLGERYKEGTHFSRSLKKAIKKYLKYRENNLKMIEGIQKAGLKNVLMNLYRGSRIAPSTEVAEILRWTQKDGRQLNKKAVLSFEGLSDLEIAEKIREEKISPIVALGILPDKISPVIAISVLEQATGNQAVILQSMFDEQGLLKEPEIVKLFEEKLITAKDALDRVNRINTSVSDEVKQVMVKARSNSRKKQMGDIGKVYLHIDISSSMDNAIEYAKKNGAIIAECVNNPEENFHWGAFNQKGYVLKKPSSFDEGGFMQVLYGLRASGSTDCFACYMDARQKGCDVDVYLTDQGHNCGSLEAKIKQAVDMGLGKPKAIVIVHFGNQWSVSNPERGTLYNACINEGIPVSFLKPEALTESALVVQAVKTAMKGAVAVIDEIMETPLLTLPKWWESVKVK